MDKDNSTNKGFGLNPRKDEMEIYKNELIKVSGPGGTFFGILANITPSKIFLKNYLDEDEIYDKKGNLIIHDARIEAEKLRMIDKDRLNVKVIGEKYLEKLVNSLIETTEFYKNLSKKIGKWYEINLGWGEPVTGKIKYIDQMTIILNPYKKFEYVGKKREPSFSLVDDDCEIFYNIQNIKFDSIDKKGVEKLLKIQNKKILEEIKKEKILEEIKSQKSS